MRAVRFADFGAPEVLTVHEIDDPACPPGGMLVMVEAAGVNHLDLDERVGVSGFALNAEHQLGREGAGTVIEVGARTDRAWLGRRVIVSAYPPCGTCFACDRGLINVCERPRRPGIEVPGTYAEVVAVPERGVFELPDEVPSDVAACLQLGFGTAWHALFRRGGLRPGQEVLITGAGGGVGSALVQLAVLAGARVIAAAGAPGRRALALELGADAAIESGPGLVDAVLEATGGRGVDLVVDATGGDVIALGVECLQPEGRYVLYGAHGGERVDLDLIGFFRSYTSLVASRGWLLEDMRQVITAVARGKITVPVQRRRLAEAAAAHRELAERCVVGKLVLQP